MDGQVSRLLLQNGFFCVYEEKDAQIHNHHFIMWQSQQRQPLLFPCHPPLIQGSTGLFMFEYQMPRSIKVS